MQSQSNTLIKKMKKSYSKRLQTKKRRRREGKTNYKHRINMIRQDQTKYGMMKSRLVVRITNTRILGQVIKAHLDGDCTVAEASSFELEKYGIEFGLTNYSAAYATGLLLATRVGSIACCLDIGLRRSSKGARVFAFLKGVIDGGIDIPYSPKLFYGYDASACNPLDSDVLRKRILGSTVAAYMIKLRDEDQEKYKKQFSNYIKNNICPESIEQIYSAAFENIKNDTEKKEKKDKTDDKNGVSRKIKKLTYEQRNLRKENKINKLIK